MVGCPVSSSALFSASLEIQTRRLTVAIFKMSLTGSFPLEIARSAAEASRELAILPAAARNDALTAIYEGLKREKETILRANAEDVASATQAVKEGKLSESILKRLDLNRPGKYDDMLQGILDVRELEDPGMEKTLLASLPIYSLTRLFTQSWQDISSDFAGR